MHNQSDASAVPQWNERKNVREKVTTGGGSHISGFIPGSSDVMSVFKILSDAARTGESVPGKVRLLEVIAVHDLNGVETVELSEPLTSFGSVVITIRKGGYILFYEMDLTR